jgi:hypothetical protein
MEPIRVEKPETANRARGKIEKILAFATTRKFRSGDNPARWRSRGINPKRGKLAAQDVTLIKA